MMSMPIAGSSLTSETVELVATAWLANATGFGVWAGDTCEAYWPEAEAPRSPDVRAPVEGVGADLALGVVGATGPAVEARLIADATLLGRLARSESELDLLAGELVDRHDQILALSELSRAIRQPLDLEASAQTIAAETRRLLKASAAFVVLRIDRESTAIGVVPDAVLDEATLRALFDKAAEAQRELVLDESGHTPAQLLIVPVRARQSIVAMVGARREGAPFQAPDLKLTLALAEQVSALVENALVHRERLNEAAMHAEMRLAARVQSDLLTRAWPPIRGLDLYATTRPASMVGGDFYDVLPLAPRGVFVSVGDVSGKGVPAALVMAMTRAVLRVAASADALDLHRLLSSAAGTLYDDLTSLEMFVTAFLAVYDAPTRQLRFVNAGHAPVIFRRGATGETELWTPDEPPLGMLPAARAPERRLRFEPGDLLVVATDGINEGRSPDGVCFGYDRLIEAITHASSGSATQIGEHVLAAAAEFRRDRPAEDDQSILVVKGVPGEA